jgi:hypothetical protein
MNSTTQELLHRMLDWHASVTRFGAESRTAHQHFEACAALLSQRTEQQAGAAEASSAAPAKELPDPWRPFGLTLNAALERGDDPALLMDENSPLRDELRRLLAPRKVIRSGFTDDMMPIADQLGAALEQEGEQPHPDDAAVDRFAAALKAKMSKQRAKGYGGWEECPVEHLQEMLFAHIPKGDPVDVGNFAMMLFARGERTAYEDQWVYDLTGKWPGVTEASATGAVTIKVVAEALQNLMTATDHTAYGSALARARAVLALATPTTAPTGFPQRIVAHLQGVAQGPFEDGNGECLMEDAKSALAWLSCAPAGKAEEPIAHLKVGKYREWMLMRDLPEGEYRLALIGTTKSEGEA